MLRLGLHPSAVIQSSSFLQEAVSLTMASQDPENEGAMVGDDNDNEDPGEGSAAEKSFEDLLDPKLSRSEAGRDALLRFLDSPAVQYLGIFVLILVVIDGALFFFLLIGWQRLCRPRLDCSPRNEWYNVSVQFLNILFTYMSLTSMPWRMTNFIHLSCGGCPKRSNAVGRNLYGKPDPDVWFHIPRGRRLGITIVLILNCVFQFVNQGTRIVFYNFDLQNSFPGNVWTNVFFGSSFLCAAIGGGWMSYEVSVLKKANPEAFGPGPMESLRDMYKKWRGNEPPTTSEANGNGPASDAAFDPTREPRRRSVLKMEGRGSMRMWAM